MVSYYNGTKELLGLHTVKNVTAQRIVNFYGAIIYLVLRYKEPLIRKQCHNNRPFNQIFSLKEACFSLLQ